MRGNRRRATEEVEGACETFKMARRLLRAGINTSKRNSWRSLLDQLDDDIYGEGYKIVTRSLRMNYPPNMLTEEEKERLATNLFPAAVEATWRTVDTDPPPPFTVEELKQGATKLKKGRAPGRDGVPSEAVKIAVDTATEYVLEAYNGLLNEGTFPTPWKEARLVLIEKPKGPQLGALPPSYRPLCLLDTMGKLYEQLILRRLQKKMEDRGVLSASQHGFRKGYSTIGAINEVITAARNAHRGTPQKWCIFVLLDVKNAFNTARWDVIVERLERGGVSNYLVNIIKNYFTNRTVWVGGRRSFRTGVGVPQGSGRPCGTSCTTACCVCQWALT